MAEYAIGFDSYDEDDLMESESDICVFFCRIMW